MDIELKLDECLMLRPFWCHFVSLHFLRCRTGAALFNLDQWPVYPVDYWVECFLRLKVLNFIEFRRGPDTLDVQVPQLQEQLTKRLRREDRIYAGFTRTGGRCWEGCAECDWSNWWEMKTSRTPQHWVDVVFSSNEAAARFAEQTSWAGWNIERELLQEYSPAYWKTLVQAYRYRFFLTEEQATEFERIQITRSNPPRFIRSSDTHSSGY